MKLDVFVYGSLLGGDSRLDPRDIFAVSTCVCKKTRARVGLLAGVE